MNLGLAKRTFVCPNACMCAYVLLNTCPFIHLQVYQTRSRRGTKYFILMGVHICTQGVRTLPDICEGVHENRVPLSLFNLPHGIETWFLWPTHTEHSFDSATAASLRSASTFAILALSSLTLSHTFAPSVASAQHPPHPHHNCSSQQHLHIASTTSACHCCWRFLRVQYLELGEKQWLCLSNALRCHAASTGASDNSAISVPSATAACSAAPPSSESLATDTAAAPLSLPPHSPPPSSLLCLA